MTRPMVRKVSSRAPRVTFPLARRHSGALAIAYRRDREPIGGQACRINPDINGALQAPDNCHLADTCGALELRLEHFVGQFGQLVTSAQTTAPGSRLAPRHCRPSR